MSSSFKKLTFLALMVISTAVKINAQTIFSQSFSTTTLTDYISASTPTSGQWNAIGASGAGTTISVAANNLSFTRTANAGSFSRTTDFSPTPTALQYVFDLTVSGNTISQTTAATWQVGSGFGTANSTESNTNTYARFGLNLSATNGTFSIRNISTSASSTTFSGTQTITWILNNSGASLNYTDPSVSSSSLANDTADIWVGTTLVFDDVAVLTTAQTMTDLKFVYDNGAGTIKMDNFSITAIPEPSTYALLGGVAILGLVGAQRFRSRRMKSATQPEVVG